jgi:hypothetical protein
MKEICCQRYTFEEMLQKEDDVDGTDEWVVFKLVHR